MRLRAVHGEDRPKLAGTFAGRLVTEVPVLVERVADVDPEPRDPALEPEAQDALELRVHVRAPPVEVGLLDGEVVQVVAPALLIERPGRPAEDGAPVVRHPVRPDVELGPLSEPWVLVGGVVRDEVEQHANPTPPGLFDEPVDVRERSEVGMDARVVGHVVAPVDVRRGKDRAQPDAVDAEPLEVLEPLHDPGQVADAVAVRVRERPRIDLVQHRLAPPGVASSRLNTHVRV